MALTYVTPSPHISQNHSTNTIILDYIFAVMPTFVLALFLFGAEIMLVVIAAVLSAVATELVFNFFYKKKFSITDASSILTGLLIGLVLPPAVPIFIPIVAALFATLVTKLLFGGYGNGIVSEVAITRIFIVVFFSQIFYASYTLPTISEIPGTTNTLIEILRTGGELPAFKDMLFGNVVGAIGETAIITIVIGGLYLIARRIVDYKIPLLYLGTVALLILIIKGPAMIVPYLMSSGLVFAAFFLASDFASCPDTLLGRIIYPILLGAITVLVWFVGDYHNAVYYALVFGGLFSTIFSNYHRPRAYGSRGGKE